MDRWTLALLIAGLVGGPANAQKKIAKVSKEDIRAILEKALKKHGVPALGAAVVTSKGLQVLAVAGVRKKGSNVAVQEADLFHLGSDTKALTATLVAVLVRQKKLSYDLTLAKGFPDLAPKMPAELRGVTLTQLLTHRSGLPGSFDWWQFSAKDPLRKQRAAAVEKLLTSKPKYRPGSTYLYSNAGYVVVGALAERATGQSWEDLLEKHLAKPLKMTTLGHGAAGTKGRIDQPLPHGEDGQPVELGKLADNPPVMGPAGRVHCSLADWARFVADQLNGAAGKDGLLSAADYKRLHEPAVWGEAYTPGGWIHVSTLLSWMYASSPRGPILMHDGNNKMNYCHALLVPGRDVAVLVVCNQGDDRGNKALKATYQVREELMKRLLK
jgi:CubicO group peptidase (beta-lactamase class C family)